MNQEKRLWKKGYKRVVCVDEAGRGPLAGPVTAAAVTIGPAKIKYQISRLRRGYGGQAKMKNILEEIKDSKRLTPEKREEIYKILTNHPAIRWGRGIVSEKIIDKINILEATKLAMKRALKNLNKKLAKQKYSDGRIRISRGRRPSERYSDADFLIIDGNFKINLDISQKSIIKADEKVFSCIAASIIAKITRDKLMTRYHKKYPQYGFDRHKGYPTKHHRKMLRKYGPCEIHRKSFKPVLRISKIKNQKHKSKIKNFNESFPIYYIYGRVKK